MLPVGSPLLTGPNHLSDAPLTVEDWRIVHHAYMAFMTTVRRVAAQAYNREAATEARGSQAGGGGGEG